MLSVEDNEALTHVGPGTLMGDLLRQYWMPALLCEELPEPDGAPVRLRLLGENLVAFRATSGKVAIIQDACPHRGASFFFGRNEEEGIRCVYHGWKFDPEGRCLDMLNEPTHNQFMDRVRARTYPCVERGGVVWTYMGPRSEPPALPDLEPNMMVEGRGRVSPNMFNWNWFQCMENNMDTAHQGILHFGAVPLEDALDPVKAQEAYPGPVEDLKYIVGNRATTFVVKETEFGASYGAYRPGEDGTDYYRTMHWLFPWVTMTPVIKLGTQANCVVTVPLDDTHTMSWSFTTGRFDQPPGASTFAANRGLLPNNADFLGRYRLKFFYDTAAEGGYDFGIDREVQKTSRTQTGYSGLASVPIQDGAITWSQGPIVDRSTENLGTTDGMIIRVRRALLNAAHALREQGTIPPGVEEPGMYRQRSGWSMVPRGQDFWEYLRPRREAFQAVDAAAKSTDPAVARAGAPVAGN
ncbi:MAG: Rieske 2Fe-2S domain-containing protein [Acidimicrobiaceae bacterium]|nr:Rieske 2Fe-2S domain-containing protein [Acidimicrobiaceae bacterium]